MAEKSLRDQIRAATVGESSHFRKKVVDYNGVHVEMREPSNKSKKELYKRCRDSEGNVDPIEFLVWSVIENTYVPDTDEKVFEKGDYDSMMSKPAGGFIDMFGHAGMELFNPEGKG